MPSKNAVVGFYDCFSCYFVASAVCPRAANPGPLLSLPHTTRSAFINLSDVRLCVKRTNAKRKVCAKVENNGNSYGHALPSLPYHDKQ